MVARLGVGIVLAVHKNIKSGRRTPETNLILCVNYNSIKREERENKEMAAHAPTLGSQAGPAMLIRTPRSSQSQEEPRLGRASHSCRGHI